LSLSTDIYQTQIGYWLKKGLSEQEAKSKLKERQITFSLDICINKHGEEKGKLIWQKRQQKWCKNNKKSNFSKISQKLFWLIYNNLKDKNNIYFATLKNGELDDSGRNNVFVTEAQREMEEANKKVRKDNQDLAFRKGVAAGASAAEKVMAEGKKKTKTKKKPALKKKASVFDWFRNTFIIS
jgi:hypothetical protein